MTTPHEAMKLALEALQDYPYDDRHWNEKCKPAIATLTAALAAMGEQEPVAQISCNPDGSNVRLTWYSNKAMYAYWNKPFTKLYAAPQPAAPAPVVQPEPVNDKGWTAAEHRVHVAAAGCGPQPFVPVTNAPVVQWPTMPPSKGQSPVLFEDGYAEGWAKCLQAIKELHGAQTINNQEYPRQWHEGVDAALEALQRLTEANEALGLDYENTAPVRDERTPGDRFENAIRAFGVTAACEWFGHSAESEFTAETKQVLEARAAMASNERT
jgi:hypothetical protein